jgi:hypothetical protein
MNFGRYPESIFGHPYITDEDVEAVTRIFTEGAESGGLADLGRAMMRSERAPIDRLHDFIFMHEARFIEVIKNDNSHESFSDRGTAWNYIIGALQQGWRIVQAETAEVNLGQLHEFGNPMPITIDEGYKLVINLRNPDAFRRSNMATRGPRVITLEYLHDWMRGRQAHAWVIHVDGLADADMAYADRMQAFEAVRPFMERGYRITELEQRLVHAPDWTVGDWEHPIPNIPEEYNIHINLESPSRFYCATAEVPNHECMPRTEMSFDIRIEHDMQQRAREELMRAFGIPEGTLTSGSTQHIDFGPTAGSCFAAVYTGGRRGGAVAERTLVDEARRFLGEDAHEVQAERERVAEARKAREKALQLFMECLNENELKEFKNLGTVTIWSKIGVFRIDASAASTPFDSSMPPTYNVYSGKNVYCVNVATPSPRTDGQNEVQTVNYPYYDHILAQMLVLKTDPKKFLAVANHRER